MCRNEGGGRKKNKRVGMNPIHLKFIAMNPE
jgi:hypothetical protein